MLTRPKETAPRQIDRTLYLLASASRDTWDLVKIAG
jgi:hypothetical protein